MAGWLTGGWMSEEKGKKNSSLSDSNVLHFACLHLKKKSFDKLRNTHNPWRDCRQAHDS